MGKKTSNLSEDRKTITLSIDAVDPDGGAVAVDWTQDQPFGTFSSTRGKDVQWSLNRAGTFTVLVTATVRGSKKIDDPDLAYIAIPVKDGKISATEIAPEITLAPQSVAIFRPLPLNVPLTSDQLDTLGVKTSAQLSATTYIYDATTNQKVKKTSNFDEIKWSSGDSTTAVVDDNGLVTPAAGSATGSATIKAESKSNSSSVAASTVTVQYLDAGITLSYPTTTIYLPNQGIPNDVTVKAAVQYTNPLDRNRVIYTDQNSKDVAWTSSNPAIAQVDSSGKVTPLADAATGDIVIKATSNYDPSRIATVSIKVRAQASSTVSFIAE